MRGSWTIVVLAVLGFAQSAASVESSLYYPPHSGRWETTELGDLDWDVEALEGVARFAQLQKSSAFIILHNGRIVIERYWDIVEPSSHYGRIRATPASDGQVREDVSSLQESVVSFLFGAAEAFDLLDIDTPVSDYLGDGWSASPPEYESLISPYHLLSMSSGFDSSYSTPGVRWHYSKSAYSFLPGVLSAVTGQSLQTLSCAWLFDPIGMSDTEWLDAPNQSAGAPDSIPGLVTSARDLARFGHLLLSRGWWNGVDILQNDAYFLRATSSSQNINPHFGLLFWLNNTVDIEDGPFSDNGIARSAPDDMFAAVGDGRRRVYVVPSTGIVVVRLGDYPPHERFEGNLWVLLNQVFIHSN